MLAFNCVPNIKMSPMEQLIYNILKQKTVEFYQEVTFDDCINPNTNNFLRFDFHIPSKNLLIKYDGIKFHATESIINRDGIKTKFAKDNKIRLVRLQGYELTKEFLELEFYQIPTSSPVKRKANGRNRIKNPYLTEAEKKKKAKKEHKQSLSNLIIHKCDTIFQFGKVKIREKDYIKK